VESVRRHAMLALLLLAALAPVPAVAQEQRGVLVLFDEDPNLPGLATINRGLRQGLRAEFGNDVSFYDESLRRSQFKEPGNDELMRDYLARRYGDGRIDLVVAVMEPPLEFLLQYREQLFAGVPIVFCGVDSHAFDDSRLPHGVTGVMMKRSFAETLDIALELKPATRDVYVVGGTTRFDLGMQDIARENFRRFEQRVRIHWLTTLPMPEMQKQLASLPEDSVVLYLTLFADGAGKSFGTHDALRLVVQAANAPVFVSLDQYLGTGAVGGSVFSVESLGGRAAQIGARILRGELPSGIPPVALAAYENVFDWRALQRWRIDEDSLPRGSELQFRKLTLWQNYQWYIVGGIALFLVQTVLVVALLIIRANRRRAELARLESESRRRRAEEDLQRQRDELAHALRLTTLGELTASIAHELNQPLTAISANAQATQKLLKSDPANPDIDEALEDLVSDSIRASEIISRLQALFRKKRAAYAPLDLNSLVDDVLHLLGSDLRLRQIQVHFTRAVVLPPVLGDGVQLRQVLINLLRNAEDAIAADGEGPRDIHVETGRSDPGTVWVTVRDSGIGLKEEADLERIFVHFVSSKPQGLGMGLAISRTIVEAHGGKIWATRDPGRGLTLHVQLPEAAG